MSKAMDALKTLWGKTRGQLEAHAAMETLRDYITTTEAERIASGKSALGLSTDIGIKYLEYAKGIVDVDPRELVAHLIDLDRSAQRQLGRDESAARIKELEEQVAAYAAVPVGMQFMNDPGMLERSWPIDFPGENGNYMCICSTCGEHFIGHKRRLTCRKCDTPAISGARKVEEPPMCTRPDLINCHAKINTGGRCMNGIQCEPIDGARKVNSLGSVRGDEHLGAMLPDEAIFDARKVEP